MVSFQQGSGGIYRNSVFINNKTGISIEFSEEYDSYQQLLNDNLDLTNNIFYNVAGNDADSLFKLDPVNADPGNITDTLSLYFTSRSNLIENPGFSVSTPPYDLLPANTIFNDLAGYSSEWYENVSYKGAFGSRNWLEKWSLLRKENIIN